MGYVKGRLRENYFRGEEIEERRGKRNERGEE
jgi:hypothetical protein